MVKQTGPPTAQKAPSVRVRPPETDEYGHPYRVVEIHGTPAGRAGGLTDLLDLLTRAGHSGVDPQDLWTVDWQGGGPGLWAGPGTDSSGAGT